MRGGLRCGVLWFVVVFCAERLLVCLSVSASPCLLCSPVLSCAVPRRAVAVAVPVRLLVLCITDTFCLSVRVSLPVCCGQYVLFESFDLPQWFHVFCFSLLFHALFQTSSCISFTNQKELEIWKSA